jgi:hypothetical protein
MKQPPPPIHPDDAHLINHDRDSIIAAAMEYARRGWSVFPTTIDKEPALRRKRYAPVCERPTAPAAIPSLFAGTGWTGIGLRLGRVSGNVYVRDFDRLDAFEKWTTLYPELARLLPTVKTAARGFHVYSVWPGVKTAEYDDGELRGEGAYVIAPPSWARSKPHMRAARYEWVRDFEGFDAVNGVCPVAAGLGVVGAAEQHSTTASNHSDNSHNSEDSNTSNTSNTFVFDPWTLEFAIQRTTVTAQGQRDRHLLMFARAMLRVPGAKQWKQPELMAAFREWWTRGVAHMNDKDFDSNYGEFLRAVRTARVPLDVEPVRVAMQAAQLSDTPAWARDLRDPRCRQLATFVRELARISNPFFLSQQTGSRAISTATAPLPGKTVWEWLRLFCELGAIRVMQTGAAHPGGKATRYEYLESDLK